MHLALSEPFFHFVIHYSNQAAWTHLRQFSECISLCSSAMNVTGTRPGVVATFAFAIPRSPTSENRDAGTD
jgi:hypothetical protein